VELGLHVKLLAVLQHCVDILKVGGAFPVVSIVAERNRTTPADRKILRQTGSSSQRLRNSIKSYKPETGQFCVKLSISYRGEGKGDG